MRRRILVCIIIVVTKPRSHHDSCTLWTHGAPAPSGSSVSDDSRSGSPRNNDNFEGLFLCYFAFKHPRSNIIFSGLWLHMNQESEKPNSSCNNEWIHALKIITVRSNHQDTYALRKGDINFSKSYLAGSLPHCLRSCVFQS